MDWSTVALSTALSAIVGTLVSLAAVSQTTVRQRRAERRDDARLALREALAPHRTQVRQYQLGMRSNLRRDPNNLNGEDLVLAATVVRLAENFHPLRRWLVARRARRLLGDLNVSIAEVDSTEAGTGSGLIRMLMAQTDPAMFDVPTNHRPGSMQQALQTDPESPELRRLERDLRRLAAGW